MFCLKDLAMVLQAYHDKIGTFPPAFIADEQGRPMHSWRVLILPFMGEKSLYDQYNFDEPWDGPNNRKLADRMPKIFSCPSHPDHDSKDYTSYLAVVGPQTVWPGESVIRLNQIADEPSKTVLLVEDQTHKICWMEPRDLTIDQAVQLLQTDNWTDETGHRFNDILDSTLAQRNVLMADRSIRLLGPRWPADSLRAVFEINDGQEITDDRWELFNLRSEETRLNTARCFQLGMFVLLVILPLPWARRRRV